MYDPEPPESDYDRELRLAMAAYYKKVELLGQERCNEIEEIQKVKWRNKDKKIFNYIQGIVHHKGYCHALYLNWARIAREQYQIEYDHFWYFHAKHCLEQARKWR